MSGRGARMYMSFALTYEYEDIVAELLDAEVLAPEMPVADVSRRLWRAGRAARMVAAERLGRTAQTSADFVLAVGQNPTDLVPGFSVADTVSNAAVSAAYIEELWIADLPLLPDIVNFLNRFDHVFLGVAATVEPLAALITPSVSYVPPAVDVLRFAASPWPRRDIATYAMGRRNAAFHEVLLERAERLGELYLYDTFTGNPPVHDHVQHRRNLRGLIRRTNTFMVNVAKVDQPGRTHQQGEVGFRFFEGAAGGAVMVGEVPEVASFGEYFPWDDAVVGVAPDGSDLDEVLDALAADPARVARIRRDNVVGSLRRHDVAHRLRTMLAELGVPEPESVGRRIGALEERATTHAGT